MRKVLLQALVEGDECSVRCESSNVTGVDLLEAFSQICNAMIMAGINPPTLKMAVDFAAFRQNAQDIE